MRSNSFLGLVSPSSGDTSRFLLRLRVVEGRSAIKRVVLGSDKRREKPFPRSQAAFRFRRNHFPATRRRRSGAMTWCPTCSRCHPPPWRSPWGSWEKDESCWPCTSAWRWSTGASPNITSPFCKNICSLQITLFLLKSSIHFTTDS